MALLEMRGRHLQGPNGADGETVRVPFLQKRELGRDDLLQRKTPSQE